MIEGAVQHIASRRFEIGGADLTKLLVEELRKSNPLVNLQIQDVEKLKEQYASCAEDELAYEKIQQSCPNEEHMLPDGQVCMYPIVLFSGAFRLLNFLKVLLANRTCSDPVMFYLH